jgi:hypothetical protein
MLNSRFSHGFSAASVISMSTQQNKQLLSGIFEAMADGDTRPLLVLLCAHGDDASR